MQRKIDILMIFMLAISFITLLTGDVVETHSKYISSANSSSEIKVATWDFKLNGVNSNSIDINLKDTLSATNKYSQTEVIPGTDGVIELDIDATNSKVALDYVINLSADQVPENLKFYTDNTYTTEYTVEEGFIGLEDEKQITHNIYWKWDFIQTDETDDWSNMDIVVTINVNATQRIGG